MLPRKSTPVCLADKKQLQDLSNVSKTLAVKIAVMFTVNSDSTNIFLTTDETYLLKQARHLQ